MDAKLFRKQTHPNFSPIINEETLAIAARRIEAPNKNTAQIDDMRYPHYASIMSDARLVTDYKTHCAANVIDSGSGNSLRAWMQHNGNGLIQTSRKRQADYNGAQYESAGTDLGYKLYQQCDAFDCTMSSTGSKYNIGLARSEPVPELFGTFSQRGEPMPPHRTPLTHVYEGGRNSIRGREYKALGNQSFNRRNGPYGASG